MTHSTAVVLVARSCVISVEPITINGDTANLTVAMFEPFSIKPGSPESSENPTTFHTSIQSLHPTDRIRPQTSKPVRDLANTFSPSSKFKFKPSSSDIVKNNFSTSSVEKPG
jgi:hypothetical protein